MRSQTKLDNYMLMAAVQGKNDDLQEQIRMGANPRAYKDAALYAAAGKGHTSTVLLLLDMGLDIHADEDQAIRSAAKNDFEETVGVLILHGADFAVLPEDQQEKFRHLVPKTPEELRAEQQSAVRVRQTSLRNFIRHRR